MRAIIYYFAASALAVLLFGCSQYAVQPRQVSSPLAADYERLLAMFPEDAQGLGREKVFDTVEEQPMTYGLTLSAESARFRRTGSEEARRRGLKAARWLAANHDLDNDGLPGWGLPQAWDAFQDGSTNPVNHPYTITTALAMNGLLDALAVPGLGSARERRQWRELLADTATRWCRECWSQGYGGGYFWYSPSKADDLFAVNSPAMFLGSISRLLREHGVLLRPEQRDLLRQRADDQARSAVATVQLSEGMPFWPYMPLPNFRNSDRPNDLIHHVYTVLGIEVYRDAGGGVTLPWTRQAALRSLDRFWYQGRIVEFPIPAASTTGPAPPGATPQTAVLWSAGMLLAGYSYWGDEESAARTLAAIQRDYGPWPNLILHTRQRSQDEAFYPRHAAHVLLGLAWQTYGRVQ